MADANTDAILCRYTGISRSKPNLKIIISTPKTFILLYIYLANDRTYTSYYLSALSY